MKYYRCDKKLLSRAALCLCGMAGLLAGSCASDSPWDSSDAKDGRIELTVMANGKVQVGTRADGDEENKDAFAIEPEGSRFSISLLSKDGSVDKTWDSLSKFNNEDGFPMGFYKLSAFYGDPDVEGFSNPYYYGEEDIEVTLGHTTVQTITATLANSMLSVRYTDDLVSMFKAYSASVQTDGHPMVAFATNETRAAYLAAGNAKFYVTLTNDKDETVTVNLMDLNLSAKHHYIVTVGVNKDNLGNPTLDVNVTEEIIKEEPLTITLTDEFFSAPVPVVTAKGFDPSTSIDFFEAFATETGEPQIHVMALAGLKSAKLLLTATDGGVLPGWNTKNEEIELVKAADTDKSKISDAKIKCYGFFENAADFGYIDFTQYVKGLDPGSYQAAVTVTDKLGRTVDVSLPQVVLKANVDEVKYDVAGYIVPDFFSEEIIIALTTNCPLIKDVFSFSANNEEGGISDVTRTVLDSNPGIANLQSEYANTYFYKLKVDPINDNQWTVKSKYAAKEITTVMDINLPTFTVVTDAFAKRVKIKIDAGDAELTQKLASVINVRNNGNLIKAENIDRKQAKDGIIIVKGLNSKNQTVDGNTFNGLYDKFTLFLGKKTARTDYTGTALTFETEEASDVPNGNFEDKDSSRGININPINVGGNYWVRVFVRSDQQITSSIERDVPAGWANLNDLTCYIGSKRMNTWYQEPSTYIENDYVVVRTVGYNHDGKEIPESGRSANTTYYCENYPAESDLFKSAGELFLGNYSFNGSASRSDGLSFQSRPSSLTFTYSFESMNNEKAVVNVRFLDTEGGVLQQENMELEASGSKSVTINFADYPFGKKAKTIELSFKSSNSANPAIHIPTGEELNEGFTATTYLANRQKAANDYHAFAKGSELKLYNVHLNYE